MKSTQKLLSITLLATILGLASCSEPEPNNNLSKDDAKTKLQSASTAVSSDLKALSDGDGLSPVKDLFSLLDTDDPFSRIGTDRKQIKTFFRTKGKEFKNIFAPGKVFNGRTAEEVPFDYNSKKGIYNWNVDTEVFEKTGESTYISILFPTEGSTDNNAELQITAYSDVKIEDGTEDIYFNPIEIKAGLFVGDKKVASIDFEATWAIDGAPTSANISLFVDPYTATVNFSGTTTTSTLITSLKSGDETLAATSAIVNYDNTSKTSDSMTTIEGYVQLKNLKLQGNIDVKAADASTTNDPNDFVHLALYADDKKAGDIIFVKDTVGGLEEDIPYLKYDNGETEKLEVVFNDVVDELDAIFND